MTETCRLCGRSWAVTMKPRESVLCSDCARPQPWRNPVHYWLARLWNLPFGLVPFRSPEWWDAQTTRNDLRFALAHAHSTFGGPTDPTGGGS